MTQQSIREALVQGGLLAAVAWKSNLSEAQLQVFRQGRRVGLCPAVAYGEARKAAP